MNLYLDYINQNWNSPSLKSSDESMINLNQVKNPNMIVLQ